MLTDLFLVIVKLVLESIKLVFGAFSLAVPEIITDSIAYIFGYLGYLEGFFPILPQTDITGIASQYGMLDIFLFYFNFLYILGLLKLSLWAYYHIPFLGGRR